MSPSLLLRRNRNISAAAATVRHGDLLHANAHSFQQKLMIFMNFSMQNESDAGWSPDPYVLTIGVWLARLTSIYGQGPALKVITKVHAVYHITSYS